MELTYVQSLIKDYSDQQATQFATIYRSRRKDPQIILLTCLLGFLGIAGVHRFLINQVGMGILYLLTGGICLIGTIVDLVNHQSLAFEFNRGVATEISAYVNNLK